VNVLATDAHGDGSCPRCRFEGALENVKPGVYSRRTGQVGAVIELAGVGLMVAGEDAWGVLLMLLGAVGVLANLRTPRASCSHCGASLAQDWKGLWYVRKG
jgi:hypothetical protein